MNQIQVKGKVGLTFATGLRSFLRQDPDVIMVGEIRDQETAQIAIQAALTGHFVLSTLHTNDAPAVTRLRTWASSPSSSSSAVEGVLAQRLVRRLCTHCREEGSTLPRGPARRGARGEPAPRPARPGPDLHALWAATGAAERATGAASASTRCS